MDTEVFFYHEEEIYRSEDGYEVAEEKEGNIGWRIKKGRKHEMVRFYFTFGWYTDEEMVEFRKKDPRIAP